MPANIKTIELRNLQIEDYKELKKSMVESYPEMADSFWKEDQIELLLKKFRRTISNCCRWNRWIGIIIISYRRFCL
jgi:two-component SAPR family response regulator